MASGLSREANTAFDQYGIDPLQDRGLIAMQKVLNYRNHSITVQQAGRPDLISHDFYKTTDLWWAILAYNGIADVRDLVEGLSIKIPEYSDIISALSQTTYTQNNSTSVTI